MNQEFKVGDRVRLSPEGLKMKEPDVVGRKPNPAWKERCGTITGQPAAKKEPHLFTIKWDDLKTKTVFHKKFLELAVEKCPKCGADYDPEKDEVLECPECGMPGATSCCNPGGRGCLCVECEEGSKDEPKNDAD